MPHEREITFKVMKMGRNESGTVEGTYVYCQLLQDNFASKMCDHGHDTREAAGRCLNARVKMVEVLQHG